MEKSTLRRADLITSVILIAFSSFIMYHSIHYMQKTLSKGRPWFESSGLFPLIISSLLLLCALLLLFRAVKDGARFDFFTKEHIIKLKNSREFKVAGIVIGLLAIYIFILIPLPIPYAIKTFVYLITFMLIFNERTKEKIIFSLIVTTIATICLTLGFGYLAKIPLP